MYGDTSVMRRRAAELREQGVDIAATAEGLVAQADGISWTGRAADAMRSRVRERAAHLKEAAALHESAADSLGLHLAEVDRLKEAIAGIEQRAASLVTDDETLAGFVPPERGHKDWLGVSLPGL
jgi:hypothetical protein